jgi:hypothetical protein
MASTRKSQASRWVAGALTLSVLLSLGASGGCDSMSYTDKGVLGGMGVGAAAGAAIARCNPVAGAVVGAAVGGLAGGITGAAIDNHEEKKAIRAAAAQRGPLGLEQIAQMAQNRVADGVIIEQIRLSGNVYNLSAEQITWLKQSGVSDAVIHEMQMTGYYGPRRRYHPAPPPPAVVYEPVYVYEPYPPPPPVAVGVGVRIR